MKADVYETAFKAVQAAAEAYRRGEPGNSQMLKFAANEALNCLMDEADDSDGAAIINLVSIARRILEATESAILDDRNPGKRDELHRLLKLETRNYPWFPVLMGPGGKTAGAQIVDFLEVGKALPINPKPKWGLNTPKNRFCVRVMWVTERLLRMAEFGETALTTAYPNLSAKQAKELFKVLGQRKKLKQLSKSNVGQWVNEVFSPTILAIDPTLKSIPEAKQVLNSKRVRENGAKIGYLRSELSKFMTEGLRTILS
jgi:hypothetical protein